MEKQEVRLSDSDEEPIQPMKKEQILLSEEYQTPSMVEEEKKEPI